jgi:hypothetical protein
MSWARLILSVMCAGPLTGCLGLTADSPHSAEEPRILWGDTVHGLRLGLCAQNQRLKLGEPVAFDVLVEALDGDKRVPRTSRLLDYFTIQVQDEKGTSPPFTATGRRVSSPPIGSWGNEANVLVTKGTCLRIRIHDLAKVFDFSLPGRYSIKVATRLGRWPTGPDGTPVTRESGTLQIALEEPPKPLWFTWEESPSGEGVRSDVKAGK